MSDDEAQGELLMPFVTVASRGGPHDDDSYTAGWEMGALNVRLESMKADLYRPELPIRRTNLSQADLVAMHHGFVMVVEEWQDQPDAVVEQWARVTFARGVYA